MFLGRSDECAVLERMVESARQGLSGAMVVRGAAGVGKTSLLDHVVRTATGFDVARVSGLQSEMPLGFAGLHRILAPFQGGFDRLPPPQRAAIGSAFGTVAGSAPDRFLVGLAVLTILSDAARTRPLLCVVDDVQWLDRDSVAALAFVCRRLLADRVVFVFALREPTESIPELDGLAELQIEGLGDGHARELLASVSEQPVDTRVARRVIAQTNGNPLAIVELGGELSSDHLIGRAPLPYPLPISRRLEQRFLRQVRSLPADTQTLMLLAAADPTCDAVTLERAAERLGVPIEATGPAEEAGVIRVGAQITFRHPLIRSAVYSGATDATRRGAHQVLAAVIDPVDDADRVASHLAACAVGLDEDLASKLERSAGAAERRGSRDAALSLLIRSAELTPDVGRRGDRLLVAAQSALAAGNLVMARSLVADARPFLVEPMQRAVGMRLEGSTLLPSGEDRPAARTLLSAARAFEPLDPVMTRETLLEAMNVFFIAGHYSEGVDVREIAAMGLETLRGVDDQRVPTDLLLSAFATLVCDGPQAALPPMRVAGEQLGSAEVSLAELSRWFQLGSYVARHLWDEELLIAMAHRLESAAREHGLLWALMVSLASVASLRTAAGDFGSAASAYAEHRDVGGAGGFIFDPRLIEVELTAWTGDDVETRGRVRTLDDLAEVYGSASLTYVAQSALTILELGQGHYAEAFVATVQVDDGGLPGWATKALPNMIEAGVRCGRAGEAAMAMERLTELASGAATPWALGTLARCRALLADPATAEPHYQQAVYHFSQTGWRTEVARSHLVYGEWLRRRKRRSDARSELRTAHEMFESMGAQGFAERARVELLATGERARSRRVDTSRALTPREAQIARLAAQRATSREIGAQLFISANTVDYHLRKVFQKLGVSSRREIARAMGLLEGASPPSGPSDDPGDTGVVDRP